MQKSYYLHNIQEAYREDVVIIKLTLQLLGRAYGHDSQYWLGLAQLASLAVTRRRRVLKMAVFINLLLVFVVFLAWLGEPTCCDSYTAISFGPQLRYVNGPPPI